MLNLNNSGSCIKADSMVNYFNQVEKHKDAVESILKSKLGEYASVNTDTVATEDGGYMTISFGISDVNDELVNFASEVSSKIDIDVDVAKKAIESYIDLYNISADIEWNEDPESLNVELFSGDKNYKDMDIKYESDKIRFEVMDALYESICEFVSSTMKKSVKLFNECWVYEYSAYEADLEEDDEL